MKTLILIILIGLTSCNKVEFQPIETGIRIVIGGFIDLPEYRPTPKFEGKKLIMTSPYIRVARLKKGDSFKVSTSYRPAPNSNPDIIRNHTITIYVNGSIYKVIEVGSNDFEYTYKQNF
jgi:hypothetical protein